MNISRDKTSYKSKKSIMTASFIKSSLPLLKLGCLSLAMLIMTSFMAPTASAKSYVNSKYSVIDEPENLSSSIEYYIGDEKQNTSSMTWSDDGFSGKALSLSGNGEYIRVNNNLLRVDAFTVAGHIKWRGAKAGLSEVPIDQTPEPTEDNPEPDSVFLPSEAETNMYNQRLFSFQRDLGASSYIIGYPHTKKEGKAGLNGFYFNVKRSPLNLDFYEKTNDESSFGFAKNKWQHFAMVFTNDTALLYLDGKLHSSQKTNVGFTQFYVNRIYIGNGDDGATLNALIDNFSFYNTSLSAEKIERLAANIEVDDNETPLPSNEKPLPTSPVSDETSAPQEPPDDNKQGLFSNLDPWVIYLSVIILIVFIGLSVMLTIYKPPAPKKSPQKRKNDGGKKNSAESFDDDENINS